MSDRSNQKEQHSVNENIIHDTLCIALLFVCIGTVMSNITA